MLKEEKTEEHICSLCQEEIKNYNKEDHLLIIFGLQIKICNICREKDYKE